ncbi:amidohydrolase [Henriciella mobilis]|uniref:amidohydrolase family protein n=1 Tax=Henriciella mobilis TaxID=2305467 RepID=UPI000E666F3F|nr:amidohydrolase family protein [Henriciella mobilis]RIJ15280.1 amidohydrolase [Henriciella mobilis]RIJ18744.1 amidohydrolase [Henriciella mobilis]
MIRRLLSACSAAAAIAFAANAQSVAITNANLWTGDDMVAGSTIVIRDGRVTAVAPDASIPADMARIDAEDAWVTPGIFSAFSRVGVVEVGAEDSTNDTTAPLATFGPALQLSDAFNPSATTIPVTRIEGVTRIAVVPGFGANMFGGQGFVADTSGEADSITKAQAFSFINLGEGGAGLSGGSRASAWATLRAALSDARTYPARYIASDEGDVLGRLDAQEFSAAARGQQLLLISVDRASDIRKVIALKDEYRQLDVALVGASEGWLVANELGEAGIPVILNQYANLPGRFESLASTQKNAGRLLDAGVTVAFAYFDDDSHQTRLVLQSAGNAVANGVSHEDALRAITSAPASIFGLDDLGSLTPGSVGDLVIWDGDPLEVMSAPTHVFINGVEQSLESRQTKLRDRYLNLDESERPLAYKR